MHFSHLATKLFNTPLVLHPGKAEVVMAALAERMGITHLMRNGEAGSIDVPAAFSERADDRPYQVVDGVAFVPVIGTLVQKLGSIHPYSGMTGYDGIRAQIALALEDPDVRAIMLDIDSPGGEVAGCFDLADAIYAVRGEKPIWAVLNECAYSAAYAIASACDRITVPRTGGCGSIGVIALLVDMSKALSQAGIRVNILQFGARKADGNEFEPLPKEVRARFQADVDTLGKLFTSTVARNRGMRVADVVATQAGTYLGAAGVKSRLADAVMAPNSAFRALARRVNQPAQPTVARSAVVHRRGR
jgi:signal peptide peptidase SppA